MVNIFISTLEAVKEECVQFVIIK